MSEQKKETLFAAFMALPDDGNRASFLADQLFQHADARSRYANMKSIDEADELFKGQFERLREMVCGRAGMPELWETFCANFTRLLNEARDRINQAERQERTNRS